MADQDQQQQQQAQLPAHPAAGAGGQPQLVVNMQELEQAMTRVATALRASGGTKIPTLEATDPASYLAWQDRARAALADNPDWPDLRQRRRLAMALVGAAGRAVRHIDYNQAANAEGLLAQYQGVFVTVAASRLTRINFATAAQEEQESLSDWHNRCRVTYQQAYPDNLQDLEHNVTMIDQFVRGIADPTICQGVYDLNPVTYAAALTTAESKLAGLAMIQHRTGTLQPRPLRVKQEPNMFALHKTPAGTKAPAAGLSSKSCWICSRLGHLQRDCPQQDPFRGTTAQPPGSGPRGRGGRVTGRGGGRGRGRGGATRRRAAVNSVGTEGTEEEDADTTAQEDVTPTSDWSGN